MGSPFVIGDLLGLRLYIRTLPTGFRRSVRQAAPNEPRLAASAENPRNAPVCQGAQRSIPVVVPAEKRIIKRERECVGQPADAEGLGQSRRLGIVESRVPRRLRRTGSFRIASSERAQYTRSRSRSSTCVRIFARS